MYDRSLKIPPLPKAQKTRQRTHRQTNLNSVARQILALREKAGLTQRELAKKVGTTPSAISRLESAGYQGHSVSMLRKLAEALNTTLHIRFERNSEHAQAPSENHQQPVDCR